MDQNSNGQRGQGGGPGPTMQPPVAPMPSTKGSFKVFTGQPFADATPAAAPGVYAAVLTEVKVVKKSPARVEMEVRWGTPLENVAPYELLWVFHLKSQAVYNHQVNDYTRVSHHARSTAAKRAQALLGREFEVDEPFDYADLARTRCMLQVSTYTTKAGVERNSVENVMAALEGANWDTDPPEGYGRELPPIAGEIEGGPVPPEPVGFMPPSPADTQAIASAASAAARKARQVSDVAQKLRDLCDRKGLGMEERKVLYTEKFGNKKIDAMGPAEQLVVLAYFEGLPDPVPTEEGGEAAPF